MNTITNTTITILRMWARFINAPFQAGLIVALLFVFFLGGCKDEYGATVNVCIPPTVTRTSPVNGGTNVPFNKASASIDPVTASVKVISATFSTPMNPKTITDRTFTVQQGETYISGTVWYSDTSALFVAPNGLVPDLPYTCTITTGVKDLAGTSLVHNYVWIFTTIAVGTPVLLSPVNGADNQSTNPTMIWNSVPGGGTYRLQVSLSPGFVSTVYDDSTLTSTSKTVSGLNVGTTYYWRVNSKISGGTSPYSDIWSFATIAPPSAPVLIAPVDNAQNQSTSPNLSWHLSPGAGTYHLQISITNTFITTVFDDSTITGSSQPVTGLMVGTTYYWRVNAKNVAGTSPYSTRNFTTIVAPLQPPTLVAPADASENIPTNPNLTWNSSVGADTYHLQVDTSTVFASTVFDDSTLTGLTKHMTNLVHGTTYYWRVNAKNSGGTSAYSTTWRFTVVPEPPQHVNLGTAERFGAIGSGAGITNEGTESKIRGSIATTGSSTMVTGFHDATAPPSNEFTETPLNIGEIRDTIYTATAPPGSSPGAVATQCLADAQTAYDYLKGLPHGLDPNAGELGGLTLGSGTYTSAGGTFKITLLDLTLDAQGDSNAQFIFQMASSLTVGSAGPFGARSIILTNGAQAKNVFWAVGTGGSGAATINAAGGGTMVGTIIAYSGVTFSTHDNTDITNLEGRALALNASVTMVNTIINIPQP